VAAIELVGEAGNDIADELHYLAGRQTSRTSETISHVSWA
jgi:hypothetical protein